MAPTSRPASRTAAAIASFCESVAGAGAATSRASVELIETTLPSTTPIETRPSWPAGRSPNVWRSSTAAPWPIGLTDTVSSDETASALRPKVSRCEAR